MSVTEYITLCVSIIGLIWTLIIVWQFVTGRPYWGEDYDSMVVPSAIITIVPGMNIVYWLVIITLCVAAFIVGGMMNIREYAVAQRERKLNDIKTKSS